MNELSLDSILETVSNLRWDWISVLDILLVTAVIFSVFLLIRGTRAVQVLRGLVVVALAVLVLAAIPGLTAFRSLVNTICRCC